MGPTRSRNGIDQHPRSPPTEHNSPSFLEVTTILTFVIIISLLSSIVLSQACIPKQIHCLVLRFLLNLIKQNNIICNLLYLLLLLNIVFNLCVVQVVHIAVISSFFNCCVLQCSIIYLAYAIISLTILLLMAISVSSLGLL